MKILISADIEGASGVVRGRECATATRRPAPDPQSAPDYLSARSWLTGDINAAVEGALEAGATSFVLHDTHGLDYRNIDPDRLHQAVEFIYGQPAIFWEFEDLDSSYDAAFLIAMHARAGEAALRSHVLGWPLFSDVRINGRPVGESEITAAVAGYHGIPTVLVTGDDVVCSEMLEWTGGNIETAVVKKSLSRYAARCLPFEVARARIREAAGRAIERIPTTQPSRFESPIRLQVTTPDRQVARYVSWMPQVEWDGDCTISYVDDDFIRVYKTLLAIFWILRSELNP